MNEKEVDKLLSEFYDKVYESGRASMRDDAVNHIQNILADINDLDCGSLYIDGQHDAYESFVKAIEELP